MNKFVYLCGSGCEEKENGKLDREIQQELKKGNIPYAPDKLFTNLHCSLLRNNALVARLNMIEYADEVVVLDGTTAITNSEISHAKKCGIPVIYRGENTDRLFKAIFEGGKQ